MEAEKTRRAVVLLSGGLDSATVLAIARDAGWTCLALSFRYGQRHDAEVRAARRVAKNLRAADHLLLDIPVGKLGGSALTDVGIEVPRDRDSTDDIPVTYVPARNTIFLAFALGYAEVTCSDAVFIGVNALDYSGYPDCRPEYVQAFQGVANLATRRAVEERPPSIEAPLIGLSKSEIIRRGIELGVDYSLTISCYDPEDAELACGRCDACRLRRRGFEEAGVPDPTRYVTAAQD